ncbi:MAG TPA: hypothetical protein VNT26_12525 [Candidatus Sulfotelmatobacter sp.]|nr:hypothetical protein [Candidatus Sulfotelmatobacter sp.]HWI55981.1 hypothetical protein [Bacillota bacterium]
MLKSITIIFAGILLLAGCATDRRSAQGSDPTGLIDWGVLELSVNTPKRLSLGEGKDCTVTAVSAAAGKLQLKIETKEKLVGGELPPGVPLGTPVESIKTYTATVPSGVQLVMGIGQRLVRFTPMVKGL